MALSNAEKQARWRERHLESNDGTKTRLQFIFDANTRAQLKRIAAHKGRPATSLIREWAASAERRIVGQLSGKALKHYTTKNNPSSSMRINSLNIISSYRYNDIWVFDDIQNDIRKEPFVAEKIELN